MAQSYAANIMNQGTKRSISRWIHLVFSIPILGYIYRPFEKIPHYAPLVQFIVPLLVLSGLWMWKGHVLRLMRKDWPTRSLNKTAGMKTGQELEA